ncbi:MAG: hypothetical protein DMF60_10260 [Acidobacteria bacterium]|nr:MAG: hypothetical protein DMF60_10260 [Acidobacteriota bacterium]
MKTRTLILSIAFLILVISHRSDGQQARPVAEQLKLAGVMPRGAMVYVQANDLSTLMKTWLASPVRSQFYDSASFAAFQKSRIYLKLQDRKKDIESAIGIELNENRVAELAGGASAVSIYDIGKIEMVFVTEVPRVRAVASTLFKQASQFSERSANGTSYYVHDVTTDGGRLNQQFCFAYVEGKLIVTTTEGLMIRAVANAKAAGSDSLLSDVVALADGAPGFAAHEVTMWLDQQRLNANRYFDNYWIHHNVHGALAGIESGLIDLRITRQGMNEQRWFKMAVGGPGLGAEAISADQLAALMKFAPTSAQLAQVHGASATVQLSSAIEQSLFGKLPEESWSPPEIPDRTRKSGNEDENTRAERYSRLDARFDMDVDDEQAPKRGKGSVGNVTGKTNSNEIAGGGFKKSIGSILDGLSPASFCEFVRSKVEAGKPFVRFERAIVAQLKPEAAVNREMLERAIIDELLARFVVAGTQPRLEWQDDGAVRFVAQALLEQGAAYSVSGNYLVLASSKEFSRDILEAAKASTPSGEKTDAALDFYALVRVSAAKPVFDTLMSKLDGREPQTKINRNKDDDEERNVKFFSENVSSLIAASAIREVRVSRRSAGSLMTEQLLYSW